MNTLPRADYLFNTLHGLENTAEDGMKNGRAREWEERHEMLSSGHCTHELTAAVDTQRKTCTLEPPAEELLAVDRLTHL